MLYLRITDKQMAIFGLVYLYNVDEPITCRISHNGSIRSNPLVRTRIPGVKEQIQRSECITGDAYVRSRTCC